LLSEAAILVLSLASDGQITIADDNTLLQFFSLATEAFAKQPDRRFPHAFYIRNASLEPWVFDKAGAYSGGSIDRSSDPDSTLRVLNAYMLLSDEYLGLNILVKQEGGARILEFAASDSTSSHRFEIDELPFVNQSDLVGEGTTCFKGRQIGAGSRKAVVKFSWTSDKTPKEVSILQRATDMHITGVPHLLAHHLIDHTAGLRRGLEFKQRHRFSVWPPFTQNDGNVNDSNPGFEDLYYRCVVINPLGVPLESYESSEELLRALRDAVKALQSLYFDANILHRDVSPRNIIISTESRESAKQPTGLLIDLDMSLDLAEKPAPGTLIGSQGYRYTWRRRTYLLP
jgi:hypothetical protein